VGRFLIVIGLVLAVIGLLLIVLPQLGLGRLPGDLVVQRKNFTLYVPIATSIVVSLVLTLLVSLWFGRK
jgi:hypothetical protein